ncbi:hypothetical protein R1sor_009240 [Riccia sorocarpa]|uniref:RING-type E3 ubiquitin transferase n=1 Tax=Riccia sorocarpa TaxID=122646 RepID=A0ABD3H986_9MARC
MEDCCAVCAEPLEWVAYGPCGHREVCFTCITRLRFVLNDKRCCICKQDCPYVYVTKALGDYTTFITDWDKLQTRIGNYSTGEVSLWYDKVVEAYVDNEEPFKTIKSMCKLYCSVCENASLEESSGKGTMEKGYVFKNIDALRRHQFGVHRVFMCELCLEGRKVFIIEQKLYTKSQLERHNYTGDSEVDGTEEERGGFAGHPECAFCKKRFYGDNELYQHMSQEHYTCHICQRARPGHYEYYRNYDDLEVHFRQEHVLCEHPDCLAKKFVVFPSEAELKKHNARAHGGHMSRSQRNAALQIPVSFQFRRSSQSPTDYSSGDYSNRHGRRGRGGHLNCGGSRTETLHAAVRGTVETAQLEEAVWEATTIMSSSESSGGNNPVGNVGRGTSGEVEAVSSGQTESDGGSEPSRYLAAVWGMGPSALRDAAFPPLPGTSGNARLKSKTKQGPATMAALLTGSGSGSGGRCGIRVLNAPEQRLASSSSQVCSVVDRTYQGQDSTYWREGVDTLVNVGFECCGAPLVGAVGGPGAPPFTGRSASRGDSSVTGNGVFPSGEWTTESGPKAAANLGISPVPLPSRNLVSLDRTSMVCIDTPDVMELSFDLRAANKALVERIRSGLKGNEQQYADFKDVSGRFRKGEMDSNEYYDRVSRLGLSFIVPELARLCPDPRKGEELMEAHSVGFINNAVDPRSLPPGLAGAFPRLRSPAPSKPAADRTPAADSASSSSFESTRYPSEKVIEKLSTDGYRRMKGKAKLEVVLSSVPAAPGTEGTLLNELAAARDRKPQVLVRASTPVIQESQQTQASSSSTSFNPHGARQEKGSWACGLCTLVNRPNIVRCAACGTPHLRNDAADASCSSDKRKKKTSKFQRVRSGNGSAVALLDTTLNAWGSPSQSEVENRSSGSRYVDRGAWSNGGGQRLVSLAQKGAILDNPWNHGK